MYLLQPIESALRGAGARKVLDLGCGNGALTKKLQDKGFEVLGCDVDEEGVACAQGRGANCFVHSVYDSPEALGDATYDVVVSAEVIEHLFAPMKLLETARYCLRPGGVLIITTPYHGYVKNLVLSLLNKWDAHMDPFWDGGHIKLWSKKTLGKALQDNGFHIESFGGAGRIPYLWKSMIFVARKT
jgi:2-polyprenyl-3-methyl-5-hydroxy-6-metoxy-1,4-benzoquinol methylase